MNNNKALFQQFVAFTTAVHQVTNDLTKDVRPASITPLQYSMLEYIAVSQPVTLSAISECLHISMPNTSRELRKLSEQLLLEKTAAADDQRKQYIRLSAEGQALMDEAFARIEARFLQQLGETDAEERKALEQAMELLLSRVFYSPRS